MTTVFADTFYFVALLNSTDRGHRRAVEFTAQFHGDMLTTTSVLTELGDAMCGVRSRQKFAEALDDLRRNASVRIVHPDEAFFQAGCELYAQRADKEWSITDCLSFMAMDRHGIREALTADRHFEQAGYLALLK